MSGSVVLITGALGQLGIDASIVFRKHGFKVVGFDIKPSNAYTLKFYDSYFEVDLSNEEACIQATSKVNPDIIIHCAAWTNVDAAEIEENHESVWKANVVATRIISKCAKKHDAKLVYISTDYVFDGTGINPWKADDKCFSPLNVYGESKLEGEFEVSKTLEKFFIVRIAWVFGYYGKNFVQTMCNLGKTNSKLCVVNDQIGTPTYTVDLAELLVQMVKTEKYGFYNATNEGGYISWYDFACEIFKQIDSDVDVIPVSSNEYVKSIAKRPLNSRLDKSKLKENGFNLLPDWRDALKRYLSLIKEQ